MLEAVGNLWSLEADARCITTNCVVGAKGLVMGAGVAREAAYRYPEIPRLWAEDQPLNRVVGSFVGEQDRSFWLVRFPTKNHWKDKSLPGTILESAVELMQLADKLSLERILLPRPGCGLGGLDWNEIKPLIAPTLDDRVTVVSFAT